MSLLCKLYLCIFISFTETFWVQTFQNLILFLIRSDVLATAED